MKTKRKINFEKSASSVENNLLEKDELERGGALFSFFDVQYDIDKAYRMINSGEYIFEIKSIPTYEIKHRSFNKGYSDSLNPDFSVAQGLVIKLPNGNDLLIDGNHRMNKAFTSGRKEMRVFYIDNPKTIKRFSKKIFAGGGNVDKKKVVDWLSKRRSNCADVTKLINHTTNSKQQSNSAEVTSSIKRTTNIIQNVIKKEVRYSPASSLSCPLSPTASDCLNDETHSKAIDNNNTEGDNANIENKITHDEIRNVISGKSKVRNGDAIQAASSYLRGNAGAGSSSERTKQVKTQTTGKINKFNGGGDLYSNILEMPREERIAFIIKTLSEDVYYSEKTLLFPELAKKTNDVLETYLRFDFEHPIINKLGDKIYFTPDARLVQRDGFIAAQIKYGVHFITSSSLDKTKRFWDAQKESLLLFLMEILLYPEGKFIQNDEHKSIIFVKEVTDRNHCCVILRVVLSSDGELMVVTMLPEKNAKYISKRKASGFWLDAPSIVPYVEESSPNVRQPKANDDIVRPESNSKDNNNSDAKNKETMESGGKVKDLIELVEKQGIIIMQYPVDEYEASMAGSAVLYNLNGRKHEIVTWNSRSDEHVAGAKTIASEEMKNKLSIGGRLMTPEEIKTSAIRDVITIPRSQNNNFKNKFGDLSELQATAIYDTFSDYENMGHEDAEADEQEYSADNLKYETVFLDKDQKWGDWAEYFDADTYGNQDYSGRVTLTKTGIEFINAVRARINSITAVDNESDMFPSEGAEPKFVDREAVLDHLYKEHHDTWALLNEIETAAVNDEKVAIFKTIELYDKDLKHHFESEEENLFPLIINDKNAERIKELIEQHGTISKMIKPIRLRDHRSIEDLVTFIKFLKSHIISEELLFSEFLKDPYEMHVSPEKNIRLDEVLSIQIKESNEIPDVVKYDITTTNPLKKKFDLPIDSENREAVKKLFKGIVGTEKGEAMRPQMQNVYASGNFMMGTNAHILMITPCSYTKKTFLFSQEWVSWATAGLDEKQKKLVAKKLNKNEVEGMGSDAHVWDVTQDTPEAKLKKHPFFNVIPKYGKENFQSEVDVYDLYDYLLLLKRYPFANQTTNHIFFNYELGGKKTETSFNGDLLMTACEKFIELGLKSMFVYMGDPNRGAMFCQHALPEDVNVYKFVQKSVTILLMPVMANDNREEIEPAALDIDFDRAFYPKFNFKTGQFTDFNGVVTHPLKAGSLLATYDFDITLKQFKAEWNRLKKAGDGNVYYKANHLLTTCIEGLYEKVFNKPKSRLLTHQIKLLLALNWLNFYKNEVK